MARKLTTTPGASGSPDTRDETTPELPFSESVATDPYNNTTLPSGIVANDPDAVTAQQQASEPSQPAEETAAAVSESAPIESDAQPPQSAEPEPTAEPIAAKPVAKKSELDILAARLTDAKNRVCFAVVAEMRAKAAFEICKDERVAASEILLAAENEMRNCRAEQYEFSGAHVDSASGGEGTPDYLSEEGGEQVDAASSSPTHWRNILLSAMGVSPAIPKGVIVKLGEAGIHTVGDLSDWTSDGRDLHDIPGVGKAKAEKIIDALAAFWGLHSEASDETEAEGNAVEAGEVAEVLLFGEPSPAIDITKALAEI